MKFELGTLDSNLYQIYQSIMEAQKNAVVSPLTLSTIVYESDTNYVLIKEVSDGAVLMAVSKNKNSDVFSGIIKALNGSDFDNLKKFLRASEF